MQQQKKQRFEEYVSHDSVVSLSSSVDTLESRNNSNAPPYPFVEFVDSQTSARLRARVNDILENTSGNPNNLPSPLPHTLTRSSLSNLLKNKDDYWVCEKSDGNRAIVFICSDGAFIIDRKYLFFRIKDQVLSTLYQGTTFETLLDGEITLSMFDDETDGKNPDAALKEIRNTPKEEWLSQQIVKKYVYCIFDVMAFNSKSFVNEKLLQRLAQCQHMMKAIDDHVKKIAAQKEIADVKAYMDSYRKNTVLRVESKRFRPSKSLMEIVGSIIPLKANTGYVHFLPSRKLKAENDGVIFTPNSNNYLMNYDENLPIYKFKWPGLNTVDFHVAPPFYDDRGHLVLYSHGYRQVDGIPPHNSRDVPKVDFEFTRMPLSIEEKQDLNTKLPTNFSAVVECAYNCKTGRWVIVGVRTDKRKGNFFTTVLSCMEATMDGLTETELAQLLNQRT